MVFRRPDKSLHKYKQIKWSVVKWYHKRNKTKKSKRSIHSVYMGFSDDDDDDYLTKYAVELETTESRVIFLSMTIFMILVNLFEQYIVISFFLSFHVAWKSWISKNDLILLNMQLLPRVFKRSSCILCYRIQTMEIQFKWSENKTKVPFTIQKNRDTTKKNGFFL